MNKETETVAQIELRDKLLAGSRFVDGVGAAWVSGW